MGEGGDEADVSSSSQLLGTSSRYIGMLKCTRAVFLARCLSWLPENNAVENRVMLVWIMLVWCY